MSFTPLRADRSCQRRTNWRFDLDPALIEMLSEALVRLGYTAQRVADRLLIFRAAHPKLQVLCVLESGRVQLRVHPTVPEMERRATAEALYANLCRCLASGVA